MTIVCLVKFLKHFLQFLSLIERVFRPINIFLIAGDLEGTCVTSLIMRCKTIGTGS